MTDALKLAQEGEILANFLRTTGLQARDLRRGVPPAPDFALSIDGRRVGIEVTQIHKSPEEQRRQSYLQEVIRRAKDAYLAAGAPPRSMRMLFNAKAPRAGDSRRELASEIAMHLATQADEMQTHKHGSDKFPALMARNVHSVTFWRTTAEPSWHSEEGTRVAPFTVELFQERVDAKHEKLDGYRAGGFDEIWLLIGAGQTNPAQRFEWHASFDPGEICSRFDRTVFCDGWQAFELGQRSTGYG